MDNKTFNDVRNTIEEVSYRDALEYFINSNGDDLTEETKEKIRQNPDEYVLFSTSQDGMEVALKDPEIHERQR
ncbi:MULTISPECIES: hypothetical protein [Chitinophagaceae]